MPGVDRYLPPRERGGINFKLDDEMRVRKRNFDDALKYYLGEHKKVLDLEEDDKGYFIDDNVIINLVKVTCDRTTQFLFPEMPEFITDPSGLADAPEEIYLRKVFEVNKGLAHFVKMATLGFLSGHVFVRVDEADVTIRNVQTYPKIVLLDPLSVVIYWDRSDSENVLWYEVKNNDTLTDYVKVTPDLWVIQNYRRNQTDLDNLFDFNTYGEWEYVSTGFHTSNVPPIIEWAHLPSPDSRYGSSEFSQKAMQDRINEVASRLHAIVRQNAAPVDVVTGADADEIDSSGDVHMITNPAARVNRLALSSDMGGIRDVLDRLIESYLSVSRVVVLKGEARDLQRVTNAAVRTLFLDALAKNALLISSYTDGLRDIARMILLLGYAAGDLAANPENLDIEIRFPTPLPTDLSEVANNNQLALIGGYISRRTAAANMGLDWRFERPQIEEDREQDMERRQEEAEIDGNANSEASQQQMDSRELPA